MVDKKITELADYTPPIDTDLVPIVDITTPATKRITWANIKAALKTYFDSLHTPISGWISTETFTYNAANKITVASGAASIYQKGDKIRYQNNNSGTWLYDYIITVADTLLTVMGNEVPNATLTDAYYSHIENPLGFQHWFNAVSPVFNVTYCDDGAGGQPTTIDCRFKISGNQCTVHYHGSGVKAGSGDRILVTSNSFPAPYSYSNVTPTGAAWAFTSGPILAIISTFFAWYFVTAIADNVVIDYLGFTSTYEI